MNKKPIHPDGDLPVFVKWMEFLEWLLPTTDKFPRKVRHSFGQRIEELALDVVEDLIEARYHRDRQAMLRRANLRLEKLRILLRLSHKLRYLPHTSYEHAMKSINETGRMLGGWFKKGEGEGEGAAA
ncbi:MAG: diversity-generating retroelement protein Avd [Acidobacteria bacterium]|nr:diversity-generating retroelement protein Avd [Acidobacteriota bacterium]